MFCAGTYNYYLEFTFHNGYRKVYINIYKTYYVPMRIVYYQTNNLGKLLTLSSNNKVISSYMRWCKLT